MKNRILAVLLLMLVGALVLVGCAKQPDSPTETTTAATTTPRGERLATPAVSVSEDGTASWEAIPHASTYLCEINGEESFVYGTSVQLTDGDSLRVLAVGSGGYLNSAFSATVTYRAPTPSALTSLAEMATVPAGKTYRVRGTVCAAGTANLLLTDGAGHYLYVYTETPHSYRIGDLVELAGVKSAYWNIYELYQLRDRQLISRDNPVSHPEAQTGDAAFFAQQMNRFVQGAYVTFEGKLTVSGSYYNFTVEGLDVALLSINYRGEALQDGTDYTVSGYLTFVSGNPARYINLIATEVREVGAPAPQTCSVCGQPLASGNHAALDCGHKACQNGNHTKCDACEEYLCLTSGHETLDCGHKACQNGSHTKCATCEEYLCKGGDHSALACGHKACEDGNHTKCATCEEYLCKGGDHSALACGHKACEDGNHTKCATCEEYLCKGGDHSALACGHKACEDGNHTNCDVCGEYLCVGDHSACQTPEPPALCDSCGQPLASGDHAALDCGHKACQNGNHTKCDACEEYLCLTSGHETLDCGHKACQNGSHTKCDACEEYLCLTSGHETLDCGHKACEDGNHTKCETCGEYLCKGGDHSALACGHKACEDGNHTKCATCGEYLCKGGDHSALACGHKACEDGNHTKCSTCEEYLCKGGDHSALACGHKACEDGNHTKCATCGEYLCKGGDHSALACGHKACEDGNHTKCSTCEEYLCKGGDHSALACGHKACEDGNHTKCATCEEYLCKGGDHSALACGHKACEDGNHTKCETCGEYLCKGGDHSALACGHKACEDGNHTKCATCEEYLCKGGDHSALACGHKACEDGNHTKCETCGEYLCDGHDPSSCGQSELPSILWIIQNGSHGETYTVEGTVCASNGPAGELMITDNLGNYLYVMFEDETTYEEHTFQKGDMLRINGMYTFFGKTTYALIATLADTELVSQGNSIVLPQAIHGNAAYFQQVINFHYTMGDFVEFTAEVNPTQRGLQCIIGTYGYVYLSYESYVAEGSICTIRAYTLYAGDGVAWVMVYDLFTSYDSVLCPACGKLFNSGNHTIADCGHRYCVMDPKLDHTECYYCSGYHCTGDHSVLSLCGHHVCDPRYTSHSPFPCCGQPSCLGGEHFTKCPACGEFTCLGEHGLCGCGHRACEEGDHTWCAVCNGYLCDGKNHSVLNACGHRACDPRYTSHSPYPCCGRPSCLGGEHFTKCPACGEFTCLGEHGLCGCGHRACEEGDHTVCDYCYEYRCDGEDHTHGRVLFQLSGSTNLAAATFTSSLDWHTEKWGLLNPLSATLEGEQRITFNTEVPEGYRLVGWYQYVDGSLSDTPFSTDTYVSMYVYGDFSFTVIFEEREVCDLVGTTNGSSTVYVDWNSCTAASPYRGTVDVGAEIYLEAPDEDSEGRPFVGWYAQKGEGAAELVSSDSACYYTVTEAVTLSAAYGEKPQEPEKPEYGEGDTCCPGCGELNVVHPICPISQIYVCACTCTHTPPEPVLNPMGTYRSEGYLYYEQHYISAGENYYDKVTVYVEYDWFLEVELHEDGTFVAAWDTKSPYVDYWEDAFLYWSGTYVSNGDGTFTLTWDTYAFGKEIQELMNHPDVEEASVREFDEPCIFRFHADGTVTGVIRTPAEITLIL